MTVSILQRNPYYKSPFWKVIDCLYFEREPLLKVSILKGDCLYSATISIQTISILKNDCLYVERGSLLKASILKGDCLYFARKSLLQVSILKGVCLYFEREPLLKVSILQGNSYSSEPYQSLHGISAMRTPIIPFMESIQKGSLSFPSWNPYRRDPYLITCPLCCEFQSLHWLF